MQNLPNLPGALRVVTLTGSALAVHIEALARLRIEIFRAFPYLYAGDRAYEARYLRRYVEAPGSVIVLVLNDAEVVGASTGMPLRYEMDEVQQPFLQQGWNVERGFYFGESVLQPHWRNLGLGLRFFAEREAHAQRLGGFEYLTFCAVQRPANHPLRPADYVPLDDFWRKRGYQAQPKLTSAFSWQDVGENMESLKPMQFWIKSLKD